MEAGDALLVIVGLVALVLGGELLVRGASGLARRLGLSSLVVGLTVVSIATSAPELAVTLDAVLGGEPGLAVGNVVGSNIALVLLVLGLAALVVPLVVGVQLLRLDVPVLVASSVLLLLLALDGSLGVVDGVVLLAVAVTYTAVVVVVGRRRDAATDSDAEGSATPDESEEPEDAASDAERRASWIGEVAALLAGVGLLVVGARLLVDGAVGIAASFGLSGLVVGLTVVAIGTSLPELVTAVVATLRGERDLAVGNAVGSGIFNICLVLGVAALVAPDGVPVADAAVALDLPLMLATAVVLLPIAYTGMAIARWEGLLFLVLYAAYTAYVLLAATEHDALEDFTSVMVFFTLPLVGLGLVVLSSYEAGRRRGVSDRTSG